MSLPAGYRHSDETRRKMSETRKGRAKSEEWRRKLSEAQKGRKTGRAPWNKGMTLPSNKCDLGCGCGKHRPKTDEQKLHMSEVMQGKNVGRKHGPPTEESREKNRLAQLGNQYAKGAKHTPAQRAKRAEINRQMWLEGKYDHKHPCWGKPGVHAGIKMNCLNSEGVFARDCDGAGIAWQYEPRRFLLSWCTYKPDFYLPEFDIWVEVKGYPKQPGEWREKVKTFREETGKTLIVTFQEELSTMTYSKSSNGADLGGESHE